MDSSCMDYTLFGRFEVGNMGRADNNWDMERPAGKELLEWR